MVAHRKTQLLIAASSGPLYLYHGFPSDGLRAFYHFK